MNVDSSQAPRLDVSDDNSNALNSRKIRAMTLEEVLALEAT
ncbi:MAG: hypothetical protein ACW968_15595 [Candidatus Thorarchaeota archaeon]|jgi:hypothetical protein